MGKRVSSERRVGGTRSREPPQQRKRVNATHSQKHVPVVLRRSRGSATLPPHADTAPTLNSLDPPLAPPIFSTLLCQRCRHHLFTLAKILFRPRLLVNQKLNLEGSEKETRHYEFSLAGSGLQYEVGDSMGVFPQNNPQLVQELLDALHFSGDEQVKNKDGETVSVREGLLKHFQITQPSKQFLEAIVEKSRGANELEGLLHPDRKNELEHYLWGLEVIDFLLDAPSIRFAPDEFVSKLRKLQPRLYSVGSSIKSLSRAGSPHDRERALREPWPEAGRSRFNLSR